MAHLNGYRRESPVGQEAPPPSPVRESRSPTGYGPRPHWPPASGPASGHLPGTPGRIQYRGDSVPRLACRPSIDDAPVLSAPGGDVLLDSTQSAAARAPFTQLPRPARGHFTDGHCRVGGSRRDSYQRQPARAHEPCWSGSRAHSATWRPAPRCRRTVGAARPGLTQARTPDRGEGGQGEHHARSHQHAGRGSRPARRGHPLSRDHGTSARGEPAREPGPGRTG